jgi:hypothetical protein
MARKVIRRIFSSIVSFIKDEECIPKSTNVKGGSSNRKTTVVSTNQRWPRHRELPPCIERNGELPIIIDSKKRQPASRIPREKPFLRSVRRNRKNLV